MNLLLKKIRFPWNMWAIRALASLYENVSCCVNCIVSLAHIGVALGVWAQHNGTFIYIYIYTQKNYPKKICKHIAVKLLVYWRKHCIIVFLAMLSKNERYCRKNMSENYFNQRPAKIVILILSLFKDQPFGIWLSGKGLGGGDGEIFDMQENNTLAKWVMTSKIIKSLFLTSTCKVFVLFPRECGVQKFLSTWHECPVL